MQDLIWRQRAKALWMKNGDRNTSFFHARTSARRRNNRIQGVYNSAGVWVDTQEGIELVLSNFFQDCYRSVDPSYIALNEVFLSVDNRVSDETNGCLLLNLQLLRWRKLLWKCTPFHPRGLMVFCRFFINGSRKLLVPK